MKSFSWKRTAQRARGILALAADYVLKSTSKRGGDCRIVRGGNGQLQRLVDPPPDVAILVLLHKRFRGKLLTAQLRWRFGLGFRPQNQAGKRFARRIV